MRIIKNLKNLLATVVFAADSNTIDIRPQGSDFGNLANLTIPNIVSGAIRLILVISALIAFVFLIVGGIKWITAGGDKEKTAGAQKTLTSALVGLVIVFASWAIIKLIETFFGIQILTLTIPTI